MKDQIRNKQNFFKRVKKRMRTKTQKAKRNNIYFLGTREKRKEKKITF
jgi:hypothetical protein